MMKCEHCGKREATSVFTQTVNGQTKTVHLCSQCAEQQMLSGWFNDFGFGNLMGFSHASHGEEKACPGCGCTFAQIRRSGRVGCAQCYTTFASRLAGTIESVHGASSHVGKIPASARTGVQLKSRVDELKTKLAQAVAQQNFEQAAVLRDEIQSLTRQQTENDQKKED